MPERQPFIDRVKSAEREALIVVASVRAATPHFVDGTAPWPLETGRRDLALTSERAETTYMIRMWADFETAARSFHEARTGHDNIQAVNLVDWLAGRAQNLRISPELREEIHEVRRYRNFLVHGTVAPDVAFGVARRTLITVLYRLPTSW